MRTYTITGSGIDHTGWFKFRALRSDGRTVQLTRKRVAELRRANRITENFSNSIQNEKRPDSRSS